MDISDGGTSCDSNDYRPMRAVSLANKLVDEVHKVLIISSDFYHQKKIKRTGGFSNIAVNQKLHISLIPSIGYKKNIGILRFVDHIILFFNLLIFLNTKSIKPPDVAFLGYPPIEPCYVLSHWLRRKKINYILDIKDNWPSIFLDLSPDFFKPLFKIILSPLYLMASYTINNANSVCSISEPFLKLITNTYRKNKKKLNLLSIDFVAPLVREPFAFNKYLIEKSNDYWNSIS